MSAKDLIDLLQPQPDDQSRVYDLCVQVENILHSYDDQFDAFAELLQNSVDAILQRWNENNVGFAPRIDVTIDYRTNRLSVLDNGCGVDPKDIELVLRPNCSLKRRLGQTNARGEKGAAVVFLQFGHRSFEFHSKQGEKQGSYVLSDGQNWFQQVTDAIKTGNVDPANLPPSQFVLNGDISKELDAIDCGSFAVVEFSDASNLSKLADVFSAQADTALTRLEYVLRTRTALGFVYTSPDKSDLPECIQKLTVNLEVRLADGTTKTAEIPTGFLYPHEIAQKRGSLASMLTNTKNKSELFYDYITDEFVRKHFDAIRKKYGTVIDRYNVTGYVSYAYNNGYYENLSAKHLDLDQDDDERTIDDIIQINGGFQIAVREYPNGRRHAFLQRSGAEDKSRSYVVLNFGGPYKPDYGRKNLSHEVRPFVNDFCKALMAFATQKDRKEKLKTGKSDASHGIRSVKEARKVLEEHAQRERNRGHWVKSGEPQFEREPMSEDEVVAEFVYQVKQGRIPGFHLYGIPAKLQLDGLFDYDLPRSVETIFNSQNNPLGVLFSEHEDAITESGKWLEFKITSDGLVDDFKRREGDAAKKYFVLVDLLVCFQVDDATEGYKIEKIQDEEEVQERTYFGVTHLLTCETDQSHTIPVICLKSLRN